MKKLLVTVASGFFGSRAAEFYRKKYEVYTPFHREMDITDEEEVYAVFENFRPDYVMHCAAISDIGECEREPERYGDKCLMCSFGSGMVWTGFERNSGNNSRSGHSVLFKIMIIVFGALLIVGSFLFFRLRNGVQIKPPQDKDIWSDREIIFYRQDDERWGEDRLGNSRYTMQSSGCLVSSIASALSMESGAEETPGALNRKLSDSQVYDTEGNLQWGSLSALGDYRVDVYQEVSSDIIEDCLSEGRYPIVRVRMYALGNIHYILIVGLQDGEYLCMDPLQDKLMKLSSYGNRVYAVRCVSFEKVSA